MNKDHISKRSGVAALAVLAAMWLSSCTQIPELDEAVPDWVHNADYPKLTPLEPLATTRSLPQDESAKIAQQMSARTDRLNSKAKWLKTPVIDEAAQARMNTGITR